MPYATIISGEIFEWQLDTIIVGKQNYHNIVVGNHLAIASSIMVLFCLE